MGASRPLRRRPRVTGPAAAAGLAVIAVIGLAGCRPTDLNSATVAYTTDRTATAELQRQHVDVSWLTCTGNYGSAAPKTPSASETAVVSVDCRGRTKDGRDITVTGRITKAVSGACVRGNLVAKVGGKEWFRVTGLGDCDATPAPVGSTYRPPTYGQRPGPTVTVTRTLWCEDDPKCRPVQGK
ncbi:hypothetical protein [Streptomyces sp. NPDC090080]|uniref:hypothetical protein n=1 Tax=Streptomyces sp. NPDC090080 TaxID=3365939 RepID=UPI0037F22420